MLAVLHETRMSQAVTFPTGTAWCSRRFASVRLEGMPSDEQLDISWDPCFADPTLWWDGRYGKPTIRHPDFRQKKSESSLWLGHWHELVLVDSQVIGWGAGRQEITRWVSSQGDFAGHERDLDVRMCKRLIEDGRVSDAMDVLSLLVQRGCHIDTHLFYRALKWCIMHKDLALGRRVHELTVESGYEGDAFLATHLMGMYGTHGRLEEAMQVFTKVPEPSCHNWATIIFAYSRHGEGAAAVRLYQRMRETTTTQPDNRIYVAVLKACAAVKNLVAGKEVHAHILAASGKPDSFVQNGLVHMYSKCGNLEEARRLFDRLPAKDVVTWTAMIAGYVQKGMGQQALQLYCRMRMEGLTPNSVTYACLLQACATVGVGALHEGKQLHAQIKQQGLQGEVGLGGSLVNMYAKCGSLEDARGVFDILPVKDVVTWTAMIAGYVQQGMSQEALGLNGSMQLEGLSRPDSVTYLCLLQACASVGVGALHVGKQLHAEITDRGLLDDLAISSSLVNMYAKCGSPKVARIVFDILPAKDVSTWTAMIAGYVQRGMGEEALSLYSSMQLESVTAPNTVTYVCLLQACASVGAGALHEGEQLYAHIKNQGLHEDVVLGSSLVNMFAKCGSLSDARRVFDTIPARNVVTWTTMIAAYAQQGMCGEALDLYSAMQVEDLSPPNSVTYVCLLQACAAVAALPVGKHLHAQIQNRGLQADPAVGAAVVSMYAKCGSMVDSQHAFDSLHERTMEAWNALIGGYTRQGNSDVVFHLLERMRQEGTHPNEITFLSVLTVCGYVGLVDKGQEYFKAMRSEYGIHASLEHFVCMIALLGRAGYLDDALQMAETMPFPPSNVVWHTLLGACWKWKNVQIGTHAFEAAVGVDEHDAASYVLMSNIYASSQMWEEAQEVQTRRKRSGAWKRPGQSWWTDVRGVVHTFVAGDGKQPHGEILGAGLELGTSHPAHEESRI